MKNPNSSENYIAPKQSSEKPKTCYCNENNPENGRGSVYFFPRMLWIEF